MKNHRLFAAFCSSHETNILSPLFASFYGNSLLVSYFRTPPISPISLQVYLTMNWKSYVGRRSMENNWGPRPRLRPDKREMTILKLDNVAERFLRYVRFDTQSHQETKTVPSTPGQLRFGEILARELQELGLEDVYLSQYGVVYAKLPANIEHTVPTVGFVAHMDTSPDLTGADVNPQIVRNYDGNDIVLNHDHNIVLSPQEFPELKKYVGKDLITTDGTTLLGADDKAGIAEIMTALEYLLNHPEIPHGNISIAFTPDEEIGAGVDNFDVAAFGADFAYTVDGGAVGELAYETFNAAEAKVRVQGRSVHPGTAKGVMINSILLAQAFIDALPVDETPATTEGYEGFYHLTNIQGTVEETTLTYIIRDFDAQVFAERKEQIAKIVDRLNAKHGPDSFKVELHDQYYNMKEQILPVYQIVTSAMEAMKAAGVEPLIRPVRGGTDGSRLSYMGLPTPNLFTGGHNAHGKFEFIPLFAMEKAVEVILNIISMSAKIL